MLPLVIPGSSAAGPQRAWCHQRRSALPSSHPHLQPVHQRVTMLSVSPTLYSAPLSTQQADNTMIHIAQRILGTALVADVPCSKTDNSQYCFCTEGLSLIRKSPQSVRRSAYGRNCAQIEGLQASKHARFLQGGPAHSMHGD